ncbi:hypothetical protein NBRC116597_08170 [Phaeobacter sp. NW0010-22]
MKHIEGIESRNPNAVGLYEFEPEADLTYALGAQGYIRTGGTNDYATLRAADAYAAAEGKALRITGKIFVKTFSMHRGDGASKSFVVETDTSTPSEVLLYLVDRATGLLSKITSDYSIESGTVTYPVSAPAMASTHELYVFVQFRPKAEWICDENTFLWFEHGALESAIWYRSSKRGIWGYPKIVNQYNRAFSDNAPKIELPANMGHIGNTLMIGYDYLTTEKHEPVRNNRFEVLVARADNTPSQPSYSSYTCNLFGWTENNDVKIGVHGTGTVDMGAFVQEHWAGMIEDDGLVFGVDDLVVAEPLETYRPWRNDIKYVSKLTGHDIKYSYIGSAMNGGSLDGVDAEGVDGMILFVGDEVGNKLVAEQAGVTGERKKFGFVRMLAAAPEGTDPVVLITGRGTDKQQDFPGTSSDLIRQAENAIDFAGFHIESDGAERTGIQLFGVVGRIDLGDLHVTGCRKGAVENEYSNAEVIYRMRGGDSILRQEFGKGVRILEANVDLGTVKQPNGDGIAKLGWDANNALIYVFGEVFQTTTAALVSDGAEQTTIVAVAKEIKVGDPVEIGGAKVIATAFLDNGATELHHTPISLDGDLAPGAQVKVDQRARVDECRVTGASSEYGVYVDGGDVFKLDLSDLKWTGRYALWLTDDATAHMVGTMPLGAGRVDSDDCYTARVDPGCHVNCQGMIIPKPDTNRVSHHFLLSRENANGPWGTLTCVGCMIEDVTTLALAVNLHEQVTLFGCYDFDGNPLPNRIVPGSWTPVLKFAGDEDATLTINDATYSLVDPDLVRVTGDITILDKDANGTPGSTAALSITGLPYGDSAEYSIGWGAIISGGVSVPDEFMARLTGGDTIYLSYQGAAGTEKIEASNVADGTRIAFQITYRRG